MLPLLVVVEMLLLEPLNPLVLTVLMILPELRLLTLLTLSLVTLLLALLLTRLLLEDPPVFEVVELLMELWGSALARVMAESHEIKSVERMLQLGTTLLVSGNGEIDWVGDAVALNHLEVVFILWGPET